MLDRREVLRIIDVALAEDAPFGDLTSYVFVPEGTRATADLVAREPGVFAGGEVFALSFTRLDDTVAVEVKVRDGERFGVGGVLATVSGPARSLLQSERVALNLVQRMCGIATRTAEYVAAVAGTGARVVDTRKTTPGLRAIERHAVRSGGGHNHRYSLSDAVMAKDNHLAVVRQVGGEITSAIKAVGDWLPHTTHVEVEVDRLDLIEPVLASGEVDTILLDNFSLDELKQGVALVGGRALVEASGGITLETIADVARTGVDLISVGALTHHIDALDLGLDVRVS